MPGYWISVPAGSFQAGSPLTEYCRQANEAQRSVTLTHAFELAVNEVTQQDFSTVMGFNPAMHKNYNPGPTSCAPYCTPGSPVESVTWHMAAAYCNALSSLAGLAPCYTCTGSQYTLSCTPAYAGSAIYGCAGYRLPTEIEWERAYRAGTSTAYYSGDDASYQGGAKCSSCFLEPSADSAGLYCKEGSQSPAPRTVGSHMNLWGFADLAGNVAEWCHDWYADSPAGGSDPAGPSTGTYRAVRNGSISSLNAELRAAHRVGALPSSGSPTVGFRCARTK